MPLAKLVWIAHSVDVSNMERIMSNLHPIFRSIFSAPGMPMAPPQQFRARLGRRRTYLSRSDALAYDAGYELYPAVLADSSHTPFRDGWLDAQDAALDEISNKPQVPTWGGMPT